MSDLENLTKLPDDFDGTVRLFPLPNVVTFPHVMQPLHVFEPRYCDLLSDAMATNRLVTMATLAEGWESGYEGHPPVEKMVCIGRVVSHTPTDDDRHNILLLGIRRARILQELPTNQTYRMARVEVMRDVYSPEIVDREKLRNELLTAFRRYIPDSALAEENFGQLLSSEMPLGAVCDIIAYTVGIPLEVKFRLLQELNVDQRVRDLVSALESTGDSNGGDPPSLTFPPPFSLN